MTGVPGKTTDKQNENKYGCVRLKIPGMAYAQDYVCVDEKDAFHIQIAVVSKQDDSTYGAVLYLDG